MRGPVRAAARSTCAAAGPPIGWERRTPETTASVSGSMSGCRNRLKSTSPSAPASSSRSAISPVELKYGRELDRHRHGHRVLDARQDVEVALLDVAAGGMRVAREVVDVQLDRGGAGVLHRPGVVGPAARRDAVEAADHRDVDGGHGALEQAHVGTRAGLLLGLVREVGQRLGERSRSRPRPAPRPARPVGAAAPRTASTARPRRRRRRPAGARRPRSSTAATADATSGLRRVSPRYSVDRSIRTSFRPSAGTRARRGSPSPRRRPSAERRTARPGRAAVRPRPGCSS